MKLRHALMLAIALPSPAWTQSALAQGRPSTLAMTCAQANCPIPVGACCVSGGSCIANRTLAQCNILNGVWQGPNTPCTPNPCAPCGPADGNINGDGGVNGRDIQAFVTAILGTPTLAERCHGDFNANSSLDIGDVPGFVAALLAAP